LAEQELRQMILAGQLVPGERLNEVLLAQTLGISRGPLREAIQRLASGGLLRMVTHKGAFIPTLTEAEISGLYELRIAIETHAVRMGAKRGTKEQFEGLQALHQETRAVLEDGAEPHHLADLDVHVRIVALAHNDGLLQAMRDARARVLLARDRSPCSPDRARAALAEHEGIVARIVAGEPSTAATLLERHLQNSLHNVLSHMRRQARS
jgi:DNA-binding GntR family transcriptional regulator